MVSNNELDMVFDCQIVFKACMNAMARPGKIFSIQEVVEKMECDNKVLTLVGLTVLDNRCQYYVHNNMDLIEELREQTMAVFSTIEEADFVLIPKAEMSQEEVDELLNSGKIGTLAEPHKSATYVIVVDSLTEGENILLSGPGIKEKIAISLPSEAVTWLEARNEQEYEFPCGIDLLFCTEAGDFMAIPRTSKVGGK
ncbi:phosphonate C-P lyase system protein PhnH [Anaerosporobacter sp.]|uniref:phosphonate C-P lyase system protein PhnH n=1 Tax=Anaerosporobacter sp. TaxID=1872529 RepID=UPI00286EDFE1|nr:phosphonate C-P lyase system protein PhnH [Anaerosporobacter sp.]